MLNSGVDIIPKQYFNFVENQVTQGHSHNILKPRATCRARRSVFVIMAVNDWNALPESVIHSTSVNAFKADLDAHWVHLWYSMPE